MIKKKQVTLNCKQIKNFLRLSSESGAIFSLTSLTTMSDQWHKLNLRGDLGMDLSFQWYNGKLIERRIQKKIQIPT